MPVWLQFVCYLVAAACFLLAGLRVQEHPRLYWLGLGLFAWVLVSLWTAAEAL